MPNRPFAILPAMMFAIGLGLAMHQGYTWWRLPSYSEAEIQQSVDLNLALDQQRLGGAAELDDAARDQQRQAVEAEVRSEIARERQEPLQYALTGLGLTLMGLLQLFLLRRHTKGKIGATRP
jgi:hypothetical protein